MVERLVHEVQRECRFADTVRPDQHHVGFLPDELGRHQLLQRAAIDPSGPSPVEVHQGLEVAQTSIPDTPLEWATRTLLLLPPQQRFDL